MEQITINPCCRDAWCPLVALWTGINTGVGVLSTRPLSVLNHDNIQVVSLRFQCWLVHLPYIVTAWRISTCGAEI